MGDRRGDWHHQYGESDGETGINMGRPTGRLASIWGDRWQTGIILGDRRGDWNQYGETDGETGIIIMGRLVLMWGERRGVWDQYGETDGETDGETGYQYGETDGESDINMGDRRGDLVKLP